MDAVLLFFVLAVGVLVLGAVVCTPLLLPWPQQVRWTVAAQAMGEAGNGPAVYPRLHLREVNLVSVDARGSNLELGVVDVGHPAWARLTFMGTTPPAAELESMLRDWCALHTPMLLYIDAAGVASLTGPVATITNLQESKAPHLTP